MAIGEIVGPCLGRSFNWAKTSKNLCLLSSFCLLILIMLTAESSAVIKRINPDQAKPLEFQISFLPLLESFPMDTTTCPHPQHTLLILGACHSWFREVGAGARALSQTVGLTQTAAYTAMCRKDRGT